MQHSTRAAEWEVAAEHRKKLLFFIAVLRVLSGYFDRPVDELRDDLRPLVFGNTFRRTDVASLFKGVYSASPTRKQQSSARVRPGPEPAGLMALSFGRRGPWAA